MNNHNIHWLTVFPSDSVSNEKRNKKKITRYFSLNTHIYFFLSFFLHLWLHLTLNVMHVFDKRHADVCVRVNRYSHSLRNLGTKHHSSHSFIHSFHRHVVFGGPHVLFLLSLLLKLAALAFTFLTGIQRPWGFICLELSVSLSGWLPRLQSWTCLPVPLV